MNRKKVSIETLSKEGGWFKSNDTVRTGPFMINLRRITRLYTTVTKCEYDIAYGNILLCPRYG